MKKLLVIILSVAMLCTASVAAFAANPIRSIGGTDSVNVSGTYVPGSATSTVYYVDITWGSMEFTYTDAAEGTWNPQDHTYDNSTAAAWSCADGANKITVTNHSNAPVKKQLLNMKRQQALTQLQAHSIKVRSVLQRQSVRLKITLLPKRLFLLFPAHFLRIRLLKQKSEP